MFEWFYKRFSLKEISASLADTGTFIPITLAMSKVGSINISSTFFWAGLYNLILGGLYDLPMVVQPQKTIAALDIRGELDTRSVMTAGFLTGSITSFLAFTGLLQRIVIIVPRHLISVIQMSQGLIFVTQGLKSVINVNNWIGVDSYLTSIFVGIFILFTWLPWKDKKIRRISENIPTSLILFIVGLIMAGSTYKASTGYYIINPFINAYIGLSGIDFYEGFKATFTQLPLTLLNSVISTVDLSHSLFSENKLSIENISYTVGLFNSVGIWFGGSPTCIGCGGLASSYKFGGRTGLTPIFTGIFYILISILFGSILLDLMSSFPNSILGILLMVSGGELAVAGSTKLKDNYLDYCICIGICLQTNIYTGFLVGIIIHLLREFVISNNEEELQSLTGEIV